MYQLIKLIYFLILSTTFWSQALKANTSYTEFYFGDASTPLVALGQEVLSNTDDVRECFPSHTAHINPHAFLRDLGLKYPVDQTQKQSLTQSKQNQNFDNLLIGFPITALSRRMAIGAVITHVSIPPQINPSHAEILTHYKLGKMQVKELQSRLTPSKEGECLLTFDLCLHRWNCDPENFRPFLQIPILGVSTKHQALIFDPNEIGIGLKNTRNLNKMKPLKEPKLSSSLSLSLEDPKTSIIDFTDSTLIFDVNAKVVWGDPVPDVASRWFLKFNLVSSEENFQSRPPTKGVGYFLNTKEELLMKVVDAIPKRIIRHRIFKDGQIKPVKYYVKNVPKGHQLAFQRGFEYWQSIFTSLISHPVLSYQFLDFDKDGQEIMTGDVRFNVMEWSNDLLKRDHKATTFSLFNQNTGETWSSNAIIYGAQLIDEYQKWFQYSHLIRESLSPSSHNNLENRSPAQINLLEPFTNILQSQTQFFLPLTPPRETFESYMMGFIQHVVGHEIGHNLGLKHNYKGNLFADDTYGANTQMDYIGAGRYKNISDEYDRMAIAYGYLGISPTRTDMFCGYENLIDNYYSRGRSLNISPECVRYDSTSQPLEHAAGQLREIVDLLTTRHHTQAYPYLIWNRSIRNHISMSLKAHILPYYFLADTHYNRLQSVLINGHRPQNPQQVKDLVLKILKSFTCDETLLNTLNWRETTNRQPNFSDEQLQENVVEFFHLLDKTVIRYTDLSASDLRICS